MQANQVTTTATPPKPSLFLRERELITERQRVGLLPMSRSTLLRKVEAGEFPQPIKTMGVRAWPRYAIEKWLAENVGVGLDGQPVTQTAGKAGGV